MLRCHCIKAAKGQKAYLREKIYVGLPVWEVMLQAQHFHFCNIFYTYFSLVLARCQFPGTCNFAIIEYVILGVIGLKIHRPCLNTYTHRLCYLFGLNQMR